MAISPETPDHAELPEPSPEFIIILAVVQAMMRSLPRKTRARFLADVSNALGLQEASYNILRFRPRSEDRVVFAAMRRARAWWRQAIAAALRMDG